MSTPQAGRELRALKLAISLYAVIFAMKVSVYLLTGVLALLAEALHTLSDVFVSGFLLLAAVWSHRQADEVHMFGHGRAQNVAALVAATLFVSFTSYRLFEEAVPRLFTPAEVSYRNLPLAIGVLVASMLLAAIPLAGLLRQGRRGAAAKAQTLELINDELALVAALVGTALIILGHPIADPIASLVVASIIVVNAVGLFRENTSLLLGSAPGEEFMASVEGVARSVPGVLGVHTLRAAYVGPDDVHTSMHVEVARGLPIEEADLIAENVRKAVCRATASHFCDVHVDPAGLEGRLLEEQLESRET